MEDYVGWFWLLAALLAANGVWLLVHPRSAWKLLSAWAYRDPDANEPSRAGYTWYGVMSLVGAATVAIILGVAASQPDVTDSDEPETGNEYEECLRDARADYDGFGLTPEDECEVYLRTPLG